MTPTPQQASFIEALLTTSNHIALVARAGTGKTSTILMAVQAYAKEFPFEEILVCAFNKAIADEVSEKLQKLGFGKWTKTDDGRSIAPKVTASTLHSMGMGLVRFAFGSKDRPVEVNDKKVRDLVDASNLEICARYGAQVIALVRYAKQAGVGFFPDLPIGDVMVWHHLADHFDVNGLDDTSEADLVVEAAQTIYRLSLNKTDVIDFDDMILFPLIKNLRVKFTKDLIFLDEAQDLSRARQALARKFLNPQSGRMIIVGDDRQAIYGFTGADAAALDNLTDSLGAVRMPLSITWRCPKKVVALAQKIVRDIEAAPSAQEGEVLKLEKMPGDLAVGDAILCRNTAPLISEAYRLIRSGKAAKVEGRQIGEGIKALAGRWKVKTIEALMNRLEDYEAREVQKALAKGNEQKVEEVRDRVATLAEICKACLEANKHMVADVLSFIDSLFADGADNAIILATYHRSKGREWDRVFLLEHDRRCPSRAAKQPWQKAQEANLAYVAFTRAKRTLAFVG